MNFTADLRWRRAIRLVYSVGVQCWCTWHTLPIAKLMFVNVAHGVCYLCGSNVQPVRIAVTGTVIGVASARWYSGAENNYIHSPNTGWPLFSCLSYEKPKQLCDRCSCSHLGKIIYPSQEVHTSISRSSALDSMTSLLLFQFLHYGRK